MHPQEGDLFVEIRVYSTLRAVVGYQHIHIESVPDMTIEHALQETLAVQPALRTRVFDEENQLQPSIRVIVNGRDIRFLDGLQTEVTPEDMICIFPAHEGKRRQQL